MVDSGKLAGVVAEMSGNSLMTIYKHYYKNTKRWEYLCKLLIRHKLKRCWTQTPRTLAYTNAFWKTGGFFICM